MSKPVTRRAGPLLVAALIFAAGCSADTVKLEDVAEPAEARIVLTPSLLSLHPGDTAFVAATVEGLDDADVLWSVSGGGFAPEPGGGYYTAPVATGEYRLTATAISSARVSATTRIEVSAAHEPFTLVAIPDIQNMIGVQRDNNDMVRVMAEWIVAAAGESNVRFVTQLGDVVDNGWDRRDWERAALQLAPLDGVVPYSVALGDHDYRREEEVSSSTANYVEFFGPRRYQEYDWYGGSSPGGTSHFQTFGALGREFLHVALEWEARGPADDPATPLGWARQVIEARPGMPTIISTHAYLWDEPGQEGRTSGEAALEGFVVAEDGGRTYPGSTGEEIFEALVEPYSQVFMVLNGHYHRGEGTSDGEYHQVSTNAAGLEVFEMLSNYQDYPNGGDGWLRLIRFVPNGGAGGLDRIEVSTYSPVLGRYQADERSEFHFDLDFSVRFESPPGPTALASTAGEPAAPPGGRDPR